jgi:uncharacterized protein
MQEQHNIMEKIYRQFLLAIGWFFLGLGFVGMFLPIIPTVPFLIVAVWAFGKSSPVLAQRIRNHKMLGPYIRDWQDHGVIPLRAKIMALMMMTATAVLVMFFSIGPLWLGLLYVAALAGIAVYILSRPSVPQ